MSKLLYQFKTDIVSEVANSNSALESRISVEVSSSSTSLESRITTKMGDLFRTYDTCIQKDFSDVRAQLKEAKTQQD